MHAGILEQERTALKKKKKKNSTTILACTAVGITGDVCLRCCNHLHWLQQQHHLTRRRASPRSCKVCGVPDQQVKLKEAIISHCRGWNICWRYCQCDHHILACPKWFKISSFKAQCDVLLLWCQNPDYTQEAWVSAEKAALFSPGMDGKKCSWELFLPWHPGLVPFEESFVGYGEIFSSSLRVCFVTWLLLGGHCCKKEVVS